MNQEYEQVHLKYEANFWSTKVNKGVHGLWAATGCCLPLQNSATSTPLGRSQMKLAGASSDELSSTKTAYDAFLADPGRLAAVRQQLQAEGLTEEQRHVLQCMEKTFT